MSFTTDDDGTQKWFDADGKQHRDGDLPAVVYPNGSQVWYQHGKAHRDGDLPAAVVHDGSKGWYRHGQRHRDGDVPAVVAWSCGSEYFKAWYQHGRRHRSHDLPAVVWADGHQEWWVNGVRQTPKDRQNRRWSALRAAFVGAVVV